MQVPLQIVFENLERSEAVEARVREEIEKLTLFHDRLTSARVVIARPQHRRHRGDTFHVRIQVDVPGSAGVAVSREPSATGAHEDVYVAIRDAFSAARRQLQDLVGSSGARE